MGICMRMWRVKAMTLNQAQTMNTPEESFQILTTTLRRPCM